MGGYPEPNRDFYFMAKDPAVLLYTSDFLSGTRTMTNEEVGMYIILLCLQHQNGKLTERDMLSICKTYVEAVYSKFDLVDGYYINKRMYEEAEKRSKFTESRRNNASAKHMLKHMGDHMEIENENRNENKNRNVLIYPSSEFQNLWEEWIEYKKEEHKDRYKSTKTEQKAINNLVKLSGGSLVVATEIVNNSIANKYKGLFEIKYYGQKAAPKNKIEQYQDWFEDTKNYLNARNNNSEADNEIKRLSL
jgi:uncharacterized protein YdaU (DUF1376 family)